MVQIQKENDSGTIHGGYIPFVCCPAGPACNPDIWRFFILYSKIEVVQGIKISWPLLLHLVKLYFMEIGPIRTLTSYLIFSGHTCTAGKD